LVEKQRTAGSGQRTEKEGKSLLGKDLRNCKKFLKFPILPFGYLRVWPNSYLVKRISYRGERRAKKRDLDADFAD